MTLFSLTNQGCSGGSSSSTIIKTFDYYYSLRFEVNNPMYLRVGNGFGDFSNNNPDIMPCDMIIDKMIVSNEEGETDQFTAEIYRNGLLIFSLVKPIGNTSITQIGGMPPIFTNDMLSVRISTFTLPISNPRVHLSLTEV